MSTKHTPKRGSISNPTKASAVGPWRVCTGPHVEDSQGISLALVQRHGYDSANGFSYWQRSDEDCQSIARLIALAPEMLDLLEHMREYLCDIANGDARMTPANASELHDQARALIARAEGES